MRCALTIAGSDSIGGAGIEADIKAMSSLGVHACAVVTAVTAQNTCEVNRIYPMSADMVQCQLDTVFRDVDIKAVKTGMLYSADIAKSVAEILEDHKMPFIVDPVMVAGVGDSLASSDLCRSIKEDIMPLCELITPNRYEAEVLANMSIESEDDAALACEIIGKGGSSVLLKGGHMSGKNVTDYFYLSSKITKMEYPRLEKAGHGGGCTLSSYITAYAARGLDIADAVRRSRDLIQKSIASMYAIGRGDKCVNSVVGMFNDVTRSKVLSEVNEVSNLLIGVIPGELVPEEGINIAYSLEDPVGPEDIASIDNGIVFHNGHLRRCGEVRYGVVDSVSDILLSVVKCDRDIRAVLNVAYSESFLDVIEEVGLDVLELNHKKDRNFCSRGSIEMMIEEYGEIPDVLVYQNTGKSASIQFLGKNPKDLFNKLKLVL